MEGLIKELISYAMFKTGQDQARAVSGKAGKGRRDNPALPTSSTIQKVLLQRQFYLREKLAQIHLGPFSSYANHRQKSSKPSYWEIG